MVSGDKTANYSIALAGDFLIACAPDVGGYPDKRRLHTAICEWLEEDDGDLSDVVIHSRVVLTDDKSVGRVVYEAIGQRLHCRLFREYRYAVSPAHTAD